MDQNSSSELTRKLTQRCSLILLALLLFGTPTSSASPESSDECQLFYSSITWIGDDPRNFTEEELNRNLSELSLVTVGLKKPSLKLLIGKNRPQYAADTQEVAAPANIYPNRSKTSSRDPRYEFAMINHEIGHAFFEENMPWPHLKLERLQPLLNGKITQLNQLSNQINELSRLKQTASSIEIEKQMRSQIAELSETRRQVFNELVTMNSNSWVIDSYHELFADLTHIVKAWETSSTKKTNRVYNWLNPDGSIFHMAFRNRHLYRDYTKVWTPAEIKKEWEKSLRIIAMGRRGNPHNLLLMIKKPLWDFIRNTPEGPQRQQILFRLQRVLGEHLHSMMPSEIALTNPIPDPEKINLELLARLEQEFLKQ